MQAKKHSYPARPVVEVCGRTAAGTLSPAPSPRWPSVHVPDSTDHQRAYCLQDTSKRPVAKSQETMP
ncbi:hypothetical protein [Methanoregula formicica]|uniref:hypothetical protein n=1 Tax=Methanoregula formicica TaxID=882104 RepID=UPI0011D2088A|nr:hypothetical protein [Methanoregula formicica]